MNNEPVKKFMDKITDTSEIPFAMATLDKNGNIKEFGPYQIDFAHEIPHIPLYTHPAKDNYRETHEGFSTVIDATHIQQRH